MGGTCCAADSEGTLVEKVDAAPAVKNGPKQKKTNKTKQNSQEPLPVDVDTWLPAEFLSFTVIGARGFRNSDWMPGLGKPDCYVVVKSKDQEIFRTKVIPDSMEPLWNEEFEYKEWEKGAELEFHLYDEDLTGSDYLGKTTIQYDRFQHGFNGDLQLEETDGNGKKHQRAYLHIKIQPPGTVYPSGPPVEFEVTLEKGNHKSFGMDINTQDTKNFYITRLVDGPVNDYNQRAAPGLQVAKGDFIVEANGVSGDAKAMVNKIRYETTVVFKVRRGINVTLVLDRKKVTNDDGTAGGLQPLGGIEYPKHETGSCSPLALSDLQPQGLVVTDVSEGLFAEWNESQNEDPVAKIQVGDRIVRVGRTRGDALTLSKAIKEVSGKFQVRLVRVAPELFDDEGQKKDGSSHWRFNH